MTSNAKNLLPVIGGIKKSFAFLIFNIKILAFSGETCEPHSFYRALIRKLFADYSH